MTIDPFMFRIPILRGPDLTTAVKRLAFLCSKTLVGLSIALMLMGVACFAMNSAYFLQLSAKLFVPSATIWWISAWFVLKAIYELGHAVVCVAHGGQLRGTGIASFYLAPVPFNLAASLAGLRIVRRFHSTTSSIGWDYRRSLRRQGQCG